jgi:hypothetical protein
MGSYLMSGPPDMDIRDISFKLRYIASVNQCYSSFKMDLDIQWSISGLYYREVVLL